MFQEVAAGKTVALPWSNVKRLALPLVLAIAAPGCFYVEQINQRPSVSIRQLSGGTPARGSRLAFSAELDDPDGDPVAPSWRAFACTTGVDPAPDCDAAAFDSGTEDDFNFTVPVTRTDGAPVLAVRVLLDATDQRGATARPEQELVVAIGDGLPVLAVRKVSLHDFVTGSAIHLFADVTDPDDAATAVSLAWTVFSPAGNPTFALTESPTAPPAVPGHRGEEYLLVAGAPGDWDVQVIATDPIGKTAMTDFLLVVTDDSPPCIASESPIAQAGQTLPLFEVTQFEVPVVTDDLDTYPPELVDSDAGAAAFRWTLATNGGARAPLAIAGNAVELDPAQFHSGDVLDLRVEVADRVDRQASFAACGDALASCALDPAVPSCTQRQTWHVEVQ